MHHYSTTTAAMARCVNITSKPVHSFQSPFVKLTSSSSDVDTEEYWLIYARFGQCAAADNK